MRNKPSRDSEVDSEFDMDNSLLSQLTGAATKQTAPPKKT